MTEPGGPDPGAAGAPGGPTEEELRQALEAELERLTVQDVVVQTLVTLVNLGARRLGLAPGPESQRDPEQGRDAIESVRALLPIAEARDAEGVRPIRDALSQLQLAYARVAGPGAAAPGGGEQAPPGAGGAPEEGSGGPEPPASGGAGPAQRSGRLWVPGQ